MLKHEFSPSVSDAGILSLLQLGAGGRSGIYNQIVCNLVGQTGCRDLPFTFYFSELLQLGGGGVDRGFPIRL